MINRLTTTDIWIWMAPSANVFANKPSEQSGLYVYMVGSDAPRVGSFRGHLDAILNVSFYVVGGMDATTNEVAMLAKIQELDNLLISHLERVMNGKIVYSVEGGTQLPVLYTDKNRPVIVKNYLFHYRASNGS